MSVPPNPQPATVAPSPWRRYWPRVRIALALAAAGVAAWAISGKSDELAGVGQYLHRLRWEWIVVSVLAELACYSALSAILRRLLRAGGTSVPSGQMLGITLAGSAIQNSFPGGTVFYLAYLFRQFRRWGSDDLLAGWVVLAFNVVTFSALAVISVVGLSIAASAGSTYDLVETILGTLLAASLVVLAVAERRRLLPHVARGVGLSQRVFRWPSPGRLPGEVVQGWAEELVAVSPSRRVWTRAAVMGLANWIGDLSCLTVSFLAVGVGVPWRGLLLAYGAGQLAATLPITPGGLGAVEGSLTVALVTFGGGQESTVAAVLLYRVVSFWLVITVGWICWAAIAIKGRGGYPAPGAEATSGRTR